MGQQIGAPGQYLPTGQFTNPPALQYSPNNISGNSLGLSPGDRWVLPAGAWDVTPGPYTFLQFLDPITQTWRTHSTARVASRRVISDGQNYSLTNQLGCPIAAVVTASNGGYVQATTTCVPTLGNSTWQVIVGGMTSVVSIATAGAGYGVPPLVEIAAPPAPGVQATAYSVIQSGTVAGVTLTNVGAGYTSVPEVRIVPSALDPNIGSAITQAVASLALVGGTAASGSISAILCTNSGASVASTVALTIAGSGTGGAATPVRLTTLTAGSVAAGGAGFTGGALTTIGGRSSATPLWTNPATDLSGFIPRPAQADFFATGSSLVSVSAIYDGGLFTGTPTVIVIPANGNLQTTTASVTITLGTSVDAVVVNPSV